jgi:hypothetical protein
MVLPRFLRVFAKPGSPNRGAATIPPKCSRVRYSTAPIQLFPLYLLRRHVLEGAYNDSWFGHRRRLRYRSGQRGYAVEHRYGLGQTEIQKLRSCRRQHDVAGLQIAVNHTVAVRYHQIVHAVLTTHVVQHTNVRMIQRRDGFGFALESLLANWIAENCSRQNLDGDSAFEARVSSAIDLAHAAGT